MFQQLKCLLIVIALIENAKSQSVQGVCFCVPTGTCNNNAGGTPGTDGTGQIVNEIFIFAST